MLNNEYNDSVSRNIHREKALKFIASSNLELNREYNLGTQLLTPRGFARLRIEDESVGCRRSSSGFPKSERSALSVRTTKQLLVD